MTHGYGSCKLCGFRTNHKAEICWQCRKRLERPTGTGVYIRKNGATIEATPEEVADLERKLGKDNVCRVVQPTEPQPETEADMHRTDGWRRSSR